jgi:hypothetical protein
MGIGVGTTRRNTRSLQSHIVKVEEAIGDLLASRETVKGKAGVFVEDHTTGRP